MPALHDVPLPICSEDEEGMWLLMLQLSVLLLRGLDVSRTVLLMLQLSDMAFASEDALGRRQAWMEQNGMRLLPDCMVQHSRRFCVA